MTSFATCCRCLKAPRFGQGIYCLDCLRTFWCEEDDGDDDG